MKRLLVVVLALAACTPFRPRHGAPQPPDPGVSARFVRLRLVEPSKIELALEVAIENPREAFRIVQVDYKVFASNRLLASVHRTLDLAVPERDTITTTLATEFTYLNLPRRAQSEMAREEEVVFSVQGELVRSGAPPLPFDAQATEAALAPSGE